jgi:hypothetical protein
MSVLPSNLIAGDQGIVDATGLPYDVVRLGRWRGSFKVEPVGQIGRTRLYDRKSVMKAAKEYRHKHLRASRA